MNSLTRENSNEQQISLALAGKVAMSNNYEQLNQGK